MIDNQEKEICGPLMGYRLFAALKDAAVPLVTSQRPDFQKDQSSDSRLDSFLGVQCQDREHDRLLLERSGEVNLAECGFFCFFFLFL